MITNLIVIFLILLLGFFFTIKNPNKTNSYKNRRQYVITVCILLILQSGLRDVSVGSDTQTYMWMYEHVGRLSWNDVFRAFLRYYQVGIGRDPGYDIFQKATQLIYEDFQVYLFIIAVIFFSAFGNFLLRNTKRLSDITLAFVIYSVLFYSFFSITGLRQTIATAATLWGFELIKKRKLIPFIILLLIASTIHKSVLIFLPFYFIVRIKNMQLFFKVILVLFPFFMVFRDELASFLQVYGGYEKYGQYEGAGTFTFTTIFLLISTLAIWRSKEILRNNPMARNYYFAFALALLYIPLTWINPSAMRIVQYFSVFMMLFIPEIVYSFQSSSPKKRSFIYNFAIVLLIILFIKANWLDPNPYRFFWE